jgi:iron complex transport system ATP-binding protein
MPVLALENVTVVRGGRRIIDRMQWQVREGERWVVLGPNGAGKTTLLQLAAARTHPTEGSVEVLDERLGAVDVFELRPRIGLASAALAEQIPAKERVLDVVLTAAYARVGRWQEEYAGMDRARATTLLAQLGAADLTERTFGTLSEGERKRVQIARALMPDPELLLLDEPAAGLDLGGREELVARLSALAADPASPALVLVTHHVEEVPPGFTHLLLLRQGRVVGAGPLHELMDSAWLTATFGLPLLVDRVAGRYVARGLLPPGYAH